MCNVQRLTATEALHFLAPLCVLFGTTHFAKE